MNTFFKILAFIATVIFISFISSSLAESFDIEFVLYGSYVIWVLALCLLYMVLPIKPTSIFSMDNVVKKIETPIGSVIKGGNSTRNFDIPVPIEPPPPPPLSKRHIIVTTNQNELYEYNS